MRTISLLFFILFLIYSCGNKTAEKEQTTKFYTISTNNFFERRKTDTILQKEIGQHKETDTLFQQYVFNVDKERHFINGFTNYPHAPPDGDYVSYELDNLGIIYTKSLTWKSYTRLHSTNDSINNLIEVALEHVILNQDLDSELKKLIKKQQKLIQFK
jgi:hypothetical protein